MHAHTHAHTHTHTMRVCAPFREHAFKRGLRSSTRPARCAHPLCSLICCAQISVAVQCHSCCEKLLAVLRCHRCCAHPLQPHPLRTTHAISLPLCVYVPHPISCALHTRVPPHCRKSASRHSSRSSTIILGGLKWGLSRGGNVFVVAELSGLEFTTAEDPSSTGRRVGGRTVAGVCMCFTRRAVHRHGCF